MESTSRTWSDLVLFLITRIYSRGGTLLSIYRIFKAIWHVLTGTSELYRICGMHVKRVNKNNQGKDKVQDDLDQVNFEKNELLRAELLKSPPPNVLYAIDRCIINSNKLFFERRSLQEEDCNVNQIVEAIQRRKKFPSSHSPNCQKSSLIVLRSAVLQMHQVFHVINVINDRAATKYDSSNLQHEKQLLTVWDRYMPDEKLRGRISKQWVNIGFQGSDPAFDFRGMGMLGLDDLVYFVTNYPTEAHIVLKHAQGPKSWYSFAIVSIQISAFCVQVLRLHALNYLFYYTGVRDKVVYHEFFCHVFIRFDTYWQYLARNPPDSPLGRPVSIMDFERVFRWFKRPIFVDLAAQRIKFKRIQETKKVN